MKKIKHTVASEPKENINPSVVNNHLLSPTSGTHPTPSPIDADLETAKDSQTAVMSSSDNEEPELKNTDTPHEIPKLPENLPIDLNSSVDELKQVCFVSIPFVFVL